MLEQNSKKQLVTFVEINIFENMLPLVSGYLQASALTDTDVRDTFRFRKYSNTVTSSFTELVNDINQGESDVFAFSCYLWNMGLIKSLLPVLLKMNPAAQFILGGPQVMRHAEQYLDPNNERLVLCNGEGERTFTNYLKELIQESPDLANVQGLSLYRDRLLITTKPENRIQDLHEIPSPFLTGMFDGDYRMAVFETNRGCPFRCSFCYWGAATNDKVFKFAEGRVIEELTWLSRNDVPLLYIADANWGMLKRDVVIAEHIANCKSENGIPFFVYFSAAKNSPKKVAAIAQIFKDADLMNTQPISMQSLDQTSLQQVNRKNIKLSAYEDLQSGLNDKGISSYIELIWPLPGETLTSFKQGIETLCERGAPHILAYPHMLLHNTPLYNRKTEYQLVTERIENGAGEEELVVQTATVNRSDFEQGLQFFYVVLALYNTSVLRHLGPFLHNNGIMSYSQLFSAFAEVCAKHPESEFMKFCEQSISGVKYSEMVNYPTVYHIVLHSSREEFDGLLYEFASRQLWWSMEEARSRFELDMLTKPFLYNNTPLRPPPFDLKFVDLIKVSGRNFLIDVPNKIDPLALGASAKSGLVTQDGFSRLCVNHSREQYPFSEQQNKEENASYCSGSVMRIGNILPEILIQPDR